MGGHASASSAAAVMSARRAGYGCFARQGAYGGGWPYGGRTADRRTGTRACRADRVTRRPGGAATVTEACRHPEAVAGLGSDDVVAQAAGATVTGPFSRPAETADLVLFLAGDRARNITGSDLVIDGGFIPTW